MELSSEIIKNKQALTVFSEDTIDIGKQVIEKIQTTQNTFD